MAKPPVPDDEDRIKEIVRLYFLDQTGVDLEAERRPSIEECLRWVADGMTRESTRRARLGNAVITILTTLVGSAIIAAASRFWAGWRS